jgi:hypothetical protein
MADHLPRPSARLQSCNTSPQGLIHTWRSHGSGRSIRPSSGQSRWPRTSGGTRQGLCISWPGHITDLGGIRTQFHHVIDIVPTRSPYLIDWVSFAACTSALAKLSSFLSTTNVATASFNACWKAAGAASPWTQLATSSSSAKESIDHCW